MRGATCRIARGWMAHAALRVGFAGRERRRSQTAAAAFGFDYVFGCRCLVQRTGFELVAVFEISWIKDGERLCLGESDSVNSETRCWLVECHEFFALGIASYRGNGSVSRWRFFLEILCNKLQF